MASCSAIRSSSSRAGSPCSRTHDCQASSAWAGGSSSVAEALITSLTSATSRPSGRARKSVTASAAPCPENSSSSDRSGSRAAAASSVSPTTRANTISQMSRTSSSSPSSQACADSPGMAFVWSSSRSMNTASRAIHHRYGRRATSMPSSAAASAASPLASSSSSVTARPAPSHQASLRSWAISGARRASAASSPGSGSRTGAIWSGRPKASFRSTRSSRPRLPRRHRPPPGGRCSG